MKKNNRVGFLALTILTSVYTMGCTDGMLGQTVGFNSLSLSKIEMTESDEIDMGLESLSSLESYEQMEVFEGENGIPVVGEETSSDDESVANLGDEDNGEGGEDGGAGDEVSEYDNGEGDDDNNEVVNEEPEPTYELVCRGNGRNCEYVRIDNGESGEYDAGERGPALIENPKYGNKKNGKFSGNGGGQFICILEGNGKSIRLGLSQSIPGGQVGTPQVLCMTQTACTGIVSQKFDVKMAHKRGFCPNKNPHVFSMTDAEVQAMIDKY